MRSDPKIKKIFIGKIGCKVQTLDYNTISKGVLDSMWDVVDMRS